MKRRREDENEQRLICHLFNSFNVGDELLTERFVIANVLVKMNGLDRTICFIVIDKFEENVRGEGE